MLACRSRSLVPNHKSSRAVSLPSCTTSNPEVFLHWANVANFCGNLGKAQNDPHVHQLWVGRALGPKQEASHRHSGSDHTGSPGVAVPVPLLAACLVGDPHTWQGQRKVRSAVQRRLLDGEPWRHRRNCTHCRHHTNCSPWRPIGWLGRMASSSWKEERKGPWRGGFPCTQGPHPIAAGAIAQVAACPYQVKPARKAGHQE